MNSSINIVYKKAQRRGFVPCVRLIDNPRTVRSNVLHTIGNVVLVPVTTVTTLFNYILINVKELVKEFILDLHQVNMKEYNIKLKHGFQIGVYLRTH